MTEVLERPRTGLRFIREANPEVPVVQQVEENDDGTVTFAGYLLRWDDVATIRDFFGEYKETFTRGAFTKTFNERGPKGNNAIKLLRQHEQRNGSFIAGKWLDLREDETGPAFEAQTIRTEPTGTNLAIEIREGVINTMSIGFDAMREEYVKDENLFDVKEAKMYEASPVYWPAYESATIESVRSVEQMVPILSRFLTVLENGGTLTPEQIGQLTHLRARIASILDRPEDAPPDPTTETATANDHASDAMARLRLYELEGL